jgi:5'-deoxynucleotidase YfbR-like HD superfamily hydrolase
MKATPKILTDIQQLVVDVSKIERRHYRPLTDARENVAEHSMSVATLAWFLHNHISSKTDINLIIKYAIVHDFVEVHAGDINTFATAKARAQKEVREQESLEKIAIEFGAFPDMVATMRAYQAMDDNAARFVWTVDKIQQLIMGRMDDWRAYYEQNIDLGMFDAKMAELLAKASPELKNIYAETIAWSRETYISKTL